MRTPTLHQRLHFVLATFAVTLPGVTSAELVDTAIHIADERGQPVPCCVYLKNEQGNPVEPPDSPFWKDHFSCDGTAPLRLAPGRYNYEIERGPEYGTERGTWEVLSESRHPLNITLRRRNHLARHGWYAGDLHIHRPIEHLPLLLRSSDVWVGPTITWWNQSDLWADRDLPRTAVRRTAEGRFYSLLAGEDERGGGALLYFGLTRPLDITNAEREYPSSLKFLKQAKAIQPRLHVDIEKPFWRDVPMWLASGLADSMGIAHNHMWRTQVLDHEAWGRPRDAAQWPGTHGNGLWSQYIYYQALNCGFRIPPSAGSASGVLHNPVGYNRCYVHVDGPLDYDKWWQSLRAGRVFVTNGPLLLVTANDRLPGHVFRRTGAPVEISVRGTLFSDDHIRKLEIIHNGDVIKEVPLAHRKDNKIDFLFRCDASGWFLVRAITSNEHTFRFASTGPFYVERGQDDRPVDPIELGAAIGPRRATRSRGIPSSRWLPGNMDRAAVNTAAQFFLTWAKERRDEVSDKLDSSQRDEVVADHDAAVAFWEEKVERSGGFTGR